MVEPYISHSKFNVHVNNLLNRLDSIDKELLISYFIDKKKKTSLLLRPTLIKFLLYKINLKPAASGSSSF